MAHPNVETLRKLDQAMESGDMAAFFGSYTDDVRSHIGGKNKLTGGYNGKAELETLFGRFMEAVGDYSFRNHAYLADDEHGVMLQTSTSQRGGKTIELQEAFVLHFRDGKISEMWYLPVDQPAFDAWVG